MNKLSATLLLCMLFSCIPSQKTQNYIKFKNEIAKDIFEEFESYLAKPIDSNEMAQIKYAINYEAFGLAGIDLLYSFDSSNFIKNRNKLQKINKIPFNILNDTSEYNKSHSEYFSVKFNNFKIAIPRANKDFCHIYDTCFSWSNLEPVILEYGKKEVFSNKTKSSLGVYNNGHSYSIGALISNNKTQIIYWLFIYN